MKRITFSLGWSLLLLTGLSMLVTNLVILPFWAGDILARETRHLHHLLVDFVPSLQANREGASSGLQSFQDEMPGGCLIWTSDSHLGQHQDNSCREGVRPLMIAADVTGKTQYSISNIALFNLLTARYIAVAVPMEPGIPSSGAVAMGVPTERLLASLWHKERVIAVYLLFNVVVFVAVAFFRLLRTLVRPLDRIAQETENYCSDGLDSFLVDRPTNELGHLAGSIQAMVRRIEMDKVALTRTVDELAVKNTLLREKQQEMIRAEKLASVGRLAAGVAHEIGNPLGVAQGYLHLRGMMDCSEEERLDFSAKGLRELERVDGLLRRLLDYARSNHGCSERFDAHCLLAEVVDDLRVQPLFRDIRITNDLEADPHDLYADREQLRQVLVNCVFNAADAVRSAMKDSSCIRLATKVLPAADKEHPMLRIFIIDNGVGIDEEILPVVFDPFFTTKEPGAGTGLGLSVSLSLIESMGGRMAMQSTLGVGTTVTILLPLAGDDQLGHLPAISRSGECASC
jgi:signal transduction histidine kinase